eukprot:Opistho-1_new@31822
MSAEVDKMKGTGYDFQTRSHHIHERSFSAASAQKRRIVQIGVAVLIAAVFLYLSHAALFGGSNNPHQGHNHAHGHNHPAPHADIQEPTAEEVDRLAAEADASADAEETAKDPDEKLPSDADDEDETDAEASESETEPNDEVEVGPAAARDRNVAEGEAEEGEGEAEGDGDGDEARPNAEVESIPEVDGDDAAAIAAAGDDARITPA